MNEIWVIVERIEKEIKPVTYEVLEAAKNLAGQSGGRVTALYPGADPPADPESLIQYGADRVLVPRNPHLEGYVNSIYLGALLPLLREEKPGLVLMGATNHGKELSAGLAAALDAGLATDCVGLHWDASAGFRVVRPVYGGKAMATVEFTEGSLRVVSLRPNVFRGPGPDSSRQGEVETRDIEVPPSALKVKLREVVREPGTQLDITEAPILVSGGLGMQGPENFKLLEELAGLLGAAVGASRPVVDNGWRPYSNQVGQTGRTVSPNLYIACGISGAVQHLAGMGFSQCIVAINKDPHAAIFSVADYGIVGDVLEILPLLIEEMRKGQE